MDKAIVIFGSTMGNTEMLAGVIVEGLKEAGFEAELKNVTEAKIEEVVNYDLVLLGSSTWGEGELQLIQFHQSRIRLLRYISYVLLLIICPLYFLLI
ncbi:MAG: hypothetical protein COA82_10940 [Alkaliphilus sp.]|nr:flavodoxin domain-containing protein [bacterium AH-315-G05]MBN4074883.1 flavodoxin domain-containing protein [bacterium AH-315-E09]PHS30850.1 MAG: hypothetical protein COA82_10940 [Alkaliphilus sp.]